jgi:hypothetical protein
LTILLHLSLKNAIKEERFQLRVQKKYIHLFANLQSLQHQPEIIQLTGLPIFPVRSCKTTGSVFRLSFTNAKELSNPFSSGTGLYPPITFISK